MAVCIVMSGTSNSGNKQVRFILPVQLCTMGIILSYEPHCMFRYMHMTCST